MRKIVLGLTTAVAIGALAVPTFASAAQMHGNGGGHAGFSGNSGGFARSSGGRNFSGTRNFAVNNNVGKFNNSRSFANPNWSANKGARNWNGNKWAWNGRHHRHHNGWWFPYAAVGAYAAYDYCWQTQWTPNGYQRVYVCGPDEYGYF